jgi:hypothetical protein
VASCRTQKFKVVDFYCWVEDVRVTFPCRGSLVTGSKELTTLCVSKWKLYFGSVFLHMELQEATEVRTAFKLASNESWLSFLTNPQGKERL